MTSEQQRFLELRAKGKTYDEIAADLGISRRTLFNWNKELHEEVSWEETAELETLRQELLGTRENRTRWLARRLEAVQAELDKRSLVELSTTRLLSLADSLHRQIIKETTPQTHGRAKPSNIHHGQAEEGRGHNQVPASESTPSPLSGGENVGMRAPSARSQSSAPSIHTSAECNESAIAVQSETGSPSPILSRTQDGLSSKGSAKREVEQDKTSTDPSHSDDNEFPLRMIPSPSTKNAQPSTSSVECKESAIAVQPEPATPSPLPEGEKVGMNGPFARSESSASAAPIQKSSHPTNQLLKCQPISPERLIGPNINFREVLERNRQTAQTK